VSGRTGHVRLSVSPPAPPLRDTTSVAFDLRTSVADAMLAWIGHGVVASTDDYLGLGLR
jgi:hypothetical protein